jgi:hypothetical protein
MKLSKGSRSLTIAIMIALLGLIVICFLAGIVLRQLSISFALANPDLQHMRIPVFLMVVSLIGIFVINLVLAELLLERILVNSIFSESSSLILRSMSWLFIAGLIPLVALFIYTELNAGRSITQIYVILFAVVYLTAGLIFRLLANLIGDAALYKQEVDLTV